MKSNTVLFFSVLLLLTFAVTILAELPGEELTQEHLDQIFQQHYTEPTGSSLQKLQPLRGDSWLEEAMKTWEAPPLSTQQASDNTLIPFGKGGVFIPRFTETSFEPDLEIYSSDREYILSGETGKTYALEPGEYRVVLGSGSHRQRITKDVTVEEDRTVALMPKWSGLIIDVVDENGQPFRGEYELARIDQFEPYGRGYGASPEMGESVRTWILEPGIYKIFGVGEGYHTLSNFVTVRLVPGELTRFLLIQDKATNDIRGGGMVQMAQTSSITPSWRYGANVGGNVHFAADIKRDVEPYTRNTSLNLNLLFDTWLVYRRKPADWNTRFRIEQGFNVSDWDITDMTSYPDKMTINSLFIWRFLPWLGPYSRMELVTSFFPEHIKRDDEKWFSFVDSDSVFNPAIGFDSSKSFEAQPSFSPTTFDLGAGVNADLATFRYFESKLRVGVSSKYSRYADRYRRFEKSNIKYNEGDSLEYAEKISNSITLQKEKNADIFEFGPQFSLGAMLRIGRYATAEAELKLFAPIAPVQRFRSPDYDFSSVLSWRLTRYLTLDYFYRRTLKQPADLDIPDDNSSHGVWLRLHFSSR
ncbi:hypothetical protein QA601_06120 [Chitinispirillales bacterium ANBcel5]|uniref:hypothetical protein n=1 Tax=Cellulosispirillum alkaliphilum TaxID=3039283 RepID=UPI002A52683F|nr:hypothetical protein [Chitinispirillales bacterium ANBcel5]